jgi:hypothetical protein
MDVGAKTEVQGKRRTDAGQKHSLTNFRQEFSPTVAMHGITPLPSDEQDSVNL